MSAHLQKNFNPNKHMGPSPSNHTPLIYAVRFEHKPFLNECLRFGGDPFVTSANGQTAFHVACASSRSSQRTDRKRKELLQMLLDQAVKKEYQLPFINGSDRERRNGMDKSYMFINRLCVCLLDRVWCVWCVCLLDKVWCVCLLDKVWCVCVCVVCVFVGMCVCVCCVCTCVCVCSHVSMLCRMRIHHYIWLLSLVYLDVLK